MDKLHRNRLSWHEDSTILLTKVWEDFRRFIPFSTTWDLLINPKRKFLIFKRVQHRLSIPYFTTVFGSIIPHLECLCQSRLHSSSLLAPQQKKKNVGPPFTVRRIPQLYLFMKCMDIYVVCHFTYCAICQVVVFNHKFIH